MSVAAAQHSVRVPSQWLEYWYFFQIFYSVMGVAVGLNIPLIGFGGFAALTLCCAWQMRRRILALLPNIALPIGMGVLYIAVQVLAFNGELLGENSRPKLTWLLGLVVVQCLALRPGFFHRGALALLLIGACTLPYLGYRGGSTTRMGLDAAITIANPNDLAAWFGFCCLYFSIVALESRRLAVRAVSATVALACLLLIAVTVSRAPLLAVAIGTLVAARRVLKRGFLPLLSLVVMAWMAYGLGVFDRYIGLYAERALEETGRLLVWPLAVERFFTAPLVGFGASNAATFIPTHSSWVTPHNQFLFVALAAGAGPLLLFIAYWVRLGVETYRLSLERHQDSAFLVPLYVYVFVIGMQLNQPYMAPWAMLTLGVIGIDGMLLTAKRQARLRWLSTSARQSPAMSAGKA